MDLDQECLQKLGENFCLEDDQKVGKDSLLKKIMTKLESLKKNSHFKIVLKNRAINNDCFSIYRSKNFMDKNKLNKKLYISFVMRKKIGNAVKRNRIKRKLRSIVQKLLTISSTINLDYIYVIFGKDKAYKEYNNSLYEKMKKSFKRMQSLKV